jgi:hypothetical protein
MDGAASNLKDYILVVTYGEHSSYYGHLIINSKRIAGFVSEKFYNVMSPEV